MQVCGVFSRFRLYAFLIVNLTVVGYQLDAYQVIKALRDNQDDAFLIDGAVLSRLEKRLLPISDLFNEVTLPCHLWDLALCLLHHSGLEAPDAVRKLWKSIIYR